MDPARIHREPDVENLRTDFIGCPSLLTRHAKKKKNIVSEPINLGFYNMNQQILLKTAARNLR